MAIGIRDLSRLKSVLNLTFIATSAGIKPSTLLSKVQNVRELSVNESDRISRVFESLGISLATKTEYKSNSWLGELKRFRSDDVPADLVIDREIIYDYLTSNENPDE